MTVEGRQLVIRGKQTEAADKQFLHRGIAARQFQRAFVLAEGIEVTGAELENGLLTIELARPKAENVIRTIAIRTHSGKPNGKGEEERVMNDELEMKNSHTFDGGRIAYIKPTGSAEAHRLGLIPPGIDIAAGREALCAARRGRQRARLHRRV